MNPEKQNNNSIIFERGLLGFTDYKEYVLLEDEIQGSPMQYLRCEEEQAIIFPVINPYEINKTYAPVIRVADLEKIQAVEEEIYICNIVTMNKTITHATINLAAPVIINTKTRKGIQIILNDDQYSTKKNMIDFVHNR